MKGHLYDSTVWINGVPTDFSFPSATIFMTSFTRPTNGKDFRTSASSLQGSISFRGKTIDLSGGASGFIDFTYAPDVYYLGDFVEAPELGSLGMVAIGLVAFWAQREGGSGCV